MTVKPLRQMWLVVHHVLCVLSSMLVPLVSDATASEVGSRGATAELRTAYVNVHDGPARMAIRFMIESQLASVKSTLAFEALADALPRTVLGGRGNSKNVATDGNTQVGCSLESGTLKVSLWHPGPGSAELLTGFIQLCTQAQFDSARVAESIQRVTTRYARRLSRPSGIVGTVLDSLLKPTSPVLSFQNPATPPRVSVSDCEREWKLMISSTAGFIGLDGNWSRDALEMVESLVPVRNSVTGGGAINSDEGNCQSYWLRDLGGNTTDIRIAIRIPEVSRSSGPDLYPWLVLASVLGSDRVFYETRSRGAAFNATVYLRLRSDGAWLIGYGSSDASKADELFDILMHAMHFPIQPLSDAELRRAQLACLGAIVGGKSSRGDRMELSTLFAAEGRPYDLEGYLQGISSLELDDVNSLTETHLVDTKILVAGPQPINAARDRCGEATELSLPD